MLISTLPATPAEAAVLPVRVGDVVTLQILRAGEKLNIRKRIKPVIAKVTGFRFSLKTRYS